MKTDYGADEEAVWRKRGLEEGRLQKRGMQWILRQSCEEACNSDAKVVSLKLKIQVNWPYTVFSDLPSHMQTNRQASYLHPT